MCDPGIRDEKARLNNKRMHVMLEYVHDRLFVFLTFLANHLVQKNSVFLNSKKTSIFLLGFT